MVFSFLIKKKIKVYIKQQKEMKKELDSLLKMEFLLKNIRPQVRQPAQ